MPNIWKHLTRPKAEAYQFPDADELLPEVFEEPPPQEEPDGPEWEAEQIEESSDPVSYAQIQADRILRDARRQAEELLEAARAEAERHREEVYEAARNDGREAGRAEGVALGIQQALEESRIAREEQAAILEAEVQRFLEQAGQALDRQLDDNVAELRDLAIAIAEKVVCVSLKSSSEVVGRMIQTAVDKRKRREWVHIYIAECDARRLSPMPAALTASLAALSDRVRVIPMADDETGTCIIEMPDEIIDASAATQMNNIRSMLADTPAGRVDSVLNFSGGGVFGRV